MPNYGVTCSTCITVIWEGDDQPADGQPIATAHADAHCQRQDCPHTTRALEAARAAAPATQTELDALRAELTRLRAMVTP